MRQSRWPSNRLARLLSLFFLIVLVWGVLWLLLDFPEHWYKAFQTVATIVMLLLLVVLQHAQNHDIGAVQVKLDEIIRAGKPAASHPLFRYFV